jgi:hypothetical protein
MIAVFSIIGGSKSLAAHYLRHTNSSGGHLDLNVMAVALYNIRARHHHVRTTALIHSMSTSHGEDAHRSHVLVRHRALV